MTGVSLEDLTVRFDDVVAVEDVTIDVNAGEFFTLVGPSGCGKTTTLRTIAGFESPTAGRVVVGGVDVTDRPPEDRNVGIVFQQYALFPHMSVAENVAYGLRFAEPPGGVGRDERVAELLDLVDLGDMGARDPETLSGGQQQRIALARALAPGPDVLLLDEPLSALDAKLRRRLRVTIREIQQELDITTIYVTHDQAEALAVSDRIAVLEDGHVEQVADPETLYRDPATRFVADFVGDHTIFRGAVTADGRFRAEDLDVALPETTSVTPGPASVAIRPEAFRVGADGGDLTIDVDQVEFLGAAYRVHGTWQGQDVIVRTSDRPPRNEPLDLSVDPADLTLLD